MSENLSEPVTLRLTTKQRSIIRHCLADMFDEGCLKPSNLDGLNRDSFVEFFSRRIVVREDGREAVLSERAYTAFRRAVDVIDSATQNDRRFGWSDVAKAVRTVYSDCFKQDQGLETADELVELLNAPLFNMIRRRTFVATLDGIRLEGPGTLQLGRLSVHHSARGVIETAGIDTRDYLNYPNTERFASSVCISGTTTGTETAATEWFKEQATLAAGMLAVDAGANYQRAATTFAIEPRVDGGSPTGQSAFAHWDERSTSFTLNIMGGGPQPLSYSAERMEELSKAPMFQHAFSVLQKSTRNSLEVPFVKAIYWYGDAHRDSIRVMQFVKYWSCLECLLGGDGRNLTNTLAARTAALLTTGPFAPFDTDNLADQVRLMKRLYQARSRAVHQASHAHVSAEDCILMSACAAHVIVTVLALLHRGQDSLTSFWSKLDDLARAHGIDNDLVGVSSHPHVR